MVKHESVQHLLSFWYVYLCEYNDYCTDPSIIPYSIIVNICSLNISLICVL